MSQTPCEFGSASVRMGMGVDPQDVRPPPLLSVSLSPFLLFQWHIECRAIYSASMRCAPHYPRESHEYCVGSEMKKADGT